MTVHSILNMIDDHGDWAGDVFGTALSAQFSIAEALVHQGESVPEEWEFEVSPLRVGLSADEDPLAFDLWVRVNSDQTLTWDHVRQAGAAMRGIVDHCKANGTAY